MKCSRVFLKHRIGNFVPAAIRILRERKKENVIKVFPFNRNAFQLVLNYILYLHQCFFELP